MLHGCHPGTAGAELRLPYLAWPGLSRVVIMSSTSAHSRRPTPDGLESTSLCVIACWFRSSKDMKHDLAEAARATRLPYSRSYSAQRLLAINVVTSNYLWT